MDSKVTYNYQVGNLAMDNAISDAIAEIKKRGHRLDSVGVRETDKAMIYEIDNVFMFAGDVIDLAQQRSSIAEIMKRNEGRVFPGAK